LGLFGKLLGKEGPKPKPESEAFDATKTIETKATKPVGDVGRERVAAIKGGIKNKYDKLGSRLSTGKEWVKGKLGSALFGTIGGVEKGIKATPEIAKKAVVFGAETAVEGAMIGKMAAQATKEGVKSGVAEATAGIKKGVKQAGEGLSGVREEIVAGGSRAAESISEVAMGVEQSYKDTKKDVSESLSEAARMAREGYRGVQREVRGGVSAFKEKLGAEVEGLRETRDAIAEGFAKKWTGIKENGARARDSVTGRISDAQDSFNDWRYRKQSRTLRELQTEGKIEQLEETVARLLRMLGEGSQLTEAKPDARLEEAEMDADFFSEAKTA
jgi:hypothetical protein